MTNEGQMNKFPNTNVAEEIQGYDNEDILEILKKAGLAKSGDAITADDYEATKNRAIVLATRNENPASIEVFLRNAFFDRMRHTERFGDEQVKNIPDETLKSIIYVDTGNKPTDEELKMLRESPLSFEQWEQERFEAKKKISDFNVAVDEGNVIAQGETSEEAIRHARDERGRRI